jgi:hypothetical protein
MDIFGMTKSYEVGDWVIYTQKKQSPAPGPRAKNINPSQHGELYSYQVDKYWVVAEVKSSEELILKTRRGKERIVASSDVRLRKARWWERLFMKGRFPGLEISSSTSSISASS